MVSDIAVWAGDPVTNNQSISSPRATGLAGSMYGSMRYQSQSNLNRIPSLDNSSNGMSSDFSGDEDDVHQLNSLELDDIMDYSSERVEGRRQNRDAKKAKKVKHATSDSIDRFELVAVDVDNLGQRLSYEGRGSRKSFPKYSKSSESRRRIALLVMALISVQDAGGADCDFGEKFSVPVEESFTFITDSQVNQCR